MAYDFSKAATPDIEKLRDRTQETLNKSPNSPNAPEWKKYIDDANAEIRKRTFIKFGVLAGAAALVWVAKKR